MTRGWNVPHGASFGFLPGMLQPPISTPPGPMRCCPQVYDWQLKSIWSVFHPFELLKIYVKK